MKQVNYSLSPHVRRCVRFYRGRWGVDTPAGERAAFGGVFAAFSSGCARSKMAQDKARYRFDRQAPTKPRNAGLFRMAVVLSVSRIRRISAISMSPNATVPMILRLSMRR